MADIRQMSYFCNTCGEAKRPEMGWYCQCNQLIAAYDSPMGRSHHFYSAPSSTPFLFQGHPHPDPRPDWVHNLVHQHREILPHQHEFSTSAKRAMPMKATSEKKKQGPKKRTANGKRDKVQGTKDVQELGSALMKLFRANLAKNRGVGPPTGYNSSRKVIEQWFGIFGLKVTSWDRGNTKVELADICDSWDTVEDVQMAKRDERTRAQNLHFLVENVQNDEKIPALAHLPRGWTVSLMTFERLGDSDFAKYLKEPIAAHNEEVRRAYHSWQPQAPQVADQAAYIPMPA